MSRARVGVWLLAAALCVPLILCAAGLQYSAPSAIPRPFAGKLVDVAGLRLRVLQQGAGQDILFMHGSPGSIEDFALQAEPLARSFRVTRYDRPGHGFSAAGVSHSLAFNAQVARALMDSLDLHDVIVVGHSYGGSSALALALLRCPRVAAYVLLDSAVYEHVRPVPAYYRLLSLPVLGIGFLRAVPRTLIEAQLARSLRREFVTRPPAGFVELRSRLWAEPHVLHALADEQLSSQAELATQSPRYREIRAPIYFAAQRDNRGRRENAERLKRDLPQTVLELLPRSGHLLQIEQPAAVARLIVRAAAATRMSVPATRR